jgi:sn-glycerol 3-phosphate transport system substrate-binding protein
MKKGITWIMTAFLLTLTVSFTMAGGSSDKSGGAGSGGGKTKVVFWYFQGGNNAENIKKFVSEFNASQDKIEVDAQYQGGNDDIMAKVRATPKGQLPDVTQFSDGTTRWAIDSGKTLKMQDFIDADKYDISGYEPNILAFYRMDNVLYSMPFQVSCPVILYNVEALAATGLDPQKAFVTMDDCLNTGRALAAQGMTQGGSFTNQPWSLLQITQGQGVELLDNGNGRKGRATQVNPQARQALVNVVRKYKAIVDDPSNPNFASGDVKNQFASGTIGYTVESCSIYSSVHLAAQFTIGFAPLPRVSASDRGGVGIGGGSLWLLDNGKQEQAKAAFEFIKFMTADAQQSRWSMSTGYLPVRRSILEAPEYQDYLKNTNPALKVAIDALANSTAASAGPVTGIWGRTTGILGEEIDAMINDKSISPETVVDNYIRRLNEEMAAYNRAN